MGATNRATLGFVAEVTKGTTPTSPAINALRNTSNTLAFTPTRVTSNEIRADRQVTDQILTDLAAAGNVGIELSFAAFDDFIEAALQGTWASKPSITVVTSDTEISDVSTTTLTVASGGASFKAGHLTLLSNFSTPADNGLFRVSSSSGTTIVYPASSFTTQGTVNVGAAVRVVGFMGASGDLTATATGLGSTSLDFTTLGLNVGEWVKIGGDATIDKFATASCNGWARISAIAATALTFDVLPVGWSTDSGTSQTIQVFTGDFVKNGTTQRAFSFERQQQDITAPSYELFKGMQIDAMSLSFKSASIITGSFDATGLSATAGTSRASGATDVAAPAYPVLNAASNVGELFEGGAPVSASFIEQIDIDLKNNLARETGVGTLGAINVRDGEIGISGTLSAYFGDLEFLSKVLNDTPTSIMVRTGRSDGNRESLLFDIPQVKLSGTAPVSAKNASRMFSGSYDAYRHPTQGYTIAAGRFWCLPVAD